MSANDERYVDGHHLNHPRTTKDSPHRMATYLHHAHTAILEGSPRHPYTLPRTPSLGTFSPNVKSTHPPTRITHTSTHKSENIKSVNVPRIYQPIYNPNYISFSLPKPH